MGLIIPRLYFQHPKAAFNQYMVLRDLEKKYLKPGIEPEHRIDGTMDIQRLFVDGSEVLRAEQTLRKDGAVLITNYVAFIQRPNKSFIFFYLKAGDDSESWLCWTIYTTDVKPPTYIGVYARRRL